MPGNSHASVRSRQVAAELRRLREAAGLSCADVAKKLGMSPSKVSRVETGMSGLQIEDLAALLGLYEVPAAKRQELVEMLRAADQKGWWTRQPGLPSLWRTLIEFEAKATRIQNYETMFVPGLLQTAEYTRAIIRGINATLSDTEVDNLVASRMARQALLSRSPAPSLGAVVDEGALRRPVGAPGVMARQLRYLAEAAQRPNIVLRVVPLAAGAHSGLQGPFVVLEFAEESDLVFVENQRMGMFLEEAADLSFYRVALANILNAALAPAATVDLVSALAAEAS
ncbi:helix-turn-helix domain-containing protein [Streptoalloteichus hindustanus]|uniref:Helix-turn-helix domain-containing protein n=1 Tax=Streptoalloteichus hindustanus TaxID=2017 RepID=A0A1M5IUX3_STRHI|nr:helix-turn-helix transcriptional regulator [Streptoalloteichus hindustanus]SHG32114.1 Helix-turn-helix domain-containing protein [Streptoalloteichus hindustanus]